jgi:hypothetical protein
MARTNRNKWMIAAGVAAGGAAAIYFLDRERGHTRRAAFATKAKHWSANVADEAVKSVRDSWHHVAGTAQQAWINLARNRWRETQRRM